LYSILNKYFAVQIYAFSRIQAIKTTVNCFFFVKHTPPFRQIRETIPLISFNHSNDFIQQNQWIRSTKPLFLFLENALFPSSFRQKTSLKLQKNGRNIFIPRNKNLCLSVRRAGYAELL